MPRNKSASKTISKRRIVFGVLFIFLSIVLCLSLFSYLLNWKEDQSQADTMLDVSIRSSNIFGKVGDWLGNLFIFESIGIAGFIIAFLFFVFGTIILKKNYFKLWKTISHSIFFICWIPVFMGAITGGRGVLSGVYGFQIMDYSSAIVGVFGLWLIILISIGLYFVLEFRNLPNILLKLKRKIVFKKNITVIPKQIAHFVQNETPFSEKNLEDLSTKSNISDAVLDEGHDEEKISFVVEKTTEDSNEEEINDNEVDDSNIFNEIKEEANDLVELHGFYDHKLDLANYQMPDVSLLKDYGSENISINHEELEENKNKIVELLKNFNVGISEIKATIGPTVTLYEIIPEAGIRVAQVKKLQDDIALNLSALGIRIIAPMPGKGTIGIEVPNRKPTMVSMRSVINSPKFQNTNMDLPIVFGKTISNEVFMADLAKMPHLLMAGATGQGKSVGINAIITSLILKKHPSELKFVMVDPKKVELSLYSKIERHYLAKLSDGEDAIITDNAKVINTLNSLCMEMDQRYELLKNAFCKNIKEYNKKFTERKLNPENGHRYLPYIVLVVDEFADLIMTAGKEVELPIARLAQLARAIGIHLIVATQRPSVNVITGMIKANFPARVAFRVISGMDSRTILDASGAEQLVGRGDMLYFNGNDLIRLQCAFVDTPEVEKIAEFIGEQKGYPDAYILPEYVGDESKSNTSNIDYNEQDPLFEEAALVVVSNQQGSTSMIQRQLKLGYNRAGRIMDQLEAHGIVGKFNGAKPRDVLIKDRVSLEQFLREMKT